MAEVRAATPEVRRKNGMGRRWKKTAEDERRERGTLRSAEDSPDSDKFWQLIEQSQSRDSVLRSRKIAVKGLQALRDMQHRILASSTAEAGMPQHIPVLLFFRRRVFSVCLSYAEEAVSEAVGTLLRAERKQYLSLEAKDENTITSSKVERRRMTRLAATCLAGQTSEFRG